MLESPFLRFLAVIVALLTLGVAFGWVALLPFWYAAVGVSVAALLVREAAWR